MSDYVKFEFGDESKHNPNSDAQRIYLQYYDQLSDLHAGTQEARRKMTFLTHDHEFQRNAEEILKLKMHGPEWINAFFRVACKRAVKVLADCETAERDKAYGDNPIYGAF